MANPEHLQILQQGVEAWNAWRNQNSDVIPNLAQADLTGPALIMTYPRATEYQKPEVL
jgi:hypothetical protein